MKYKYYLLKKYDQVVLAFAVCIHECSGIYITDVQLKDPSALPYDLRVVTCGKLWRWICGRMVKLSSRKNRQLMYQNHLHDITDILEACHALSWTDPYWVSKETEMLLFSQISLHNMTEMQLTQKLVHCGGKQEKEVIYLASTAYLCKSSRQSLQFTGYEAFNEYFAAQLAACMGLTMVNYDLYSDSAGESVSAICPFFTSEDISFLPYGSYASSFNLHQVKQEYAKLGSTFSETLNSILVLDYLISNYDRNDSNLGFLLDRNSEIVGCAPVFDHANSLLNGILTDGGEDMLCNPIGADPFQLAVSCVEKKQYELLQRLLSFQFQQHPHFLLEKCLVNKLNDSVLQRCRKLLSVCDTFV